MDGHSNEAAANDDLELVRAARSGDRLAFGLLYLRHHAAAWRVACVASRFSPDAELAVIEGFTRVFSALPRECEEFGASHVSFRPYLLACVRQAALERARAAGRAEDADAPRRRRPAGPPAPSSPAGLGADDGEVVLSSLEHHVVRGALIALPERSRTALWLSDVEAMTPTEVAAILGDSPQEVADVTARARAEMRAGREAALGRHEVRADCRFTVARLDEYAAGTLDPAKGVLVRSHLDLCPPCRMRLGELANAPATLAAAVPAAPLLGGEAQHHWLASAGDIRPAQRLLSPGQAAAAPAHRLPDVLRRAGRAASHGWLLGPEPIALTSSPGPPGHPPGWTGAPGWSPSPAPVLPPDWTVPARRAMPAPGRDRRRRRLSAAAGRVPVVVRRAGRAAWPALPATFLVVAWMGVMLSLPHLMNPGTEPGPGGLALPAVQAYVPGYLPGARGPVTPRPAEGSPSGGAAFTAGGAAAGAIPVEADPGRAPAGSAAQKASTTPAIRLIPTVVRPSGPVSQSPAPSPLPGLPPAGDVAGEAGPVTVASAPLIPSDGPTVDDPAAPPARPGRAMATKTAKARTAAPPGRPGAFAESRHEARRAEKAEAPEWTKRARGRQDTKTRGRAVTA